MHVFPLAFSAPAPLRRDSRRSTRRTGVTIARIGEKTPGTLTARSETLNFLRNATASSRSSHVFDLTSVYEEGRRGGGVGEVGRDRERDIYIGGHIVRERERERKIAEEDSENITSYRERLRLDGVRRRRGVMHLNLGVGHPRRS